MSAADKYLRQETEAGRIGQPWDGKLRDEKKRYRVYLELEDPRADEGLEPLFCTEARAYSIEGLKERNEETYAPAKVIAIRCLDNPLESRVYW
jgi:hypothetical protein